MPNRPALRRIVETAVYCKDLARAHDFYVNILGARVLLDTERLLALDVHRESVLLLFRRDATTVPLVTAGGVVPPHGAEGVQHLAFAVAAEDLEQWGSHLEASGVEIESRVKWPRGGESVYVRDPDGHSVEFITPGLWETY